MSSKIFESAVSEGRLSVAEAPNRRFTVGIRRNGVATDMVDIAPSDAPALALAILEAAGVPMQGKFERRRSGTSEHLSFIAQHLERYVVESEHLTAEAEAQAKLEAEALELRKAWKLGDGVQVQKFEDLIEVAQEKWLAVACRAREINKEEK